MPAASRHRGLDFHLPQSLRRRDRSCPAIHRELAMDLQFSTACLPRFSLRSSFVTTRALGLDSVQIALTPTLYRRGPERLAREAERYGVTVRSLDLGMLGGVAMTREAVA